MKKLFLVFYLFQFLSASSQVNVTFIVKDKTLLERKAIYITGEFRNWDSIPAKEYLFKNTGNHEWTLTLKLKPGTYQYKYNGGTWWEVEKRWNFDEVPNRSVTFSGDTVIRDTVEEWRDLFIQNKKYIIYSTLPDTLRLTAYTGLASAYIFSAEIYNTDSAFQNIQQASQLLEKLKSSGEFRKWDGFTNWQFNIQEIAASILHALGNYPGALKLRLENLELAKVIGNVNNIIAEMFSVLHDYERMNDYQSVVHYSRQIDALLPKADKKFYPVIESTLKYYYALSYFHLNNIDSALYYARYVFDKNYLKDAGYAARSAELLGEIYTVQSNADSAIFYYRNAIWPASTVSMFHIIAAAQLGMARLFRQVGVPDSALYYAKAAINLAEEKRIPFRAWGENADVLMAQASKFLAEVYRHTGKTDSAYKYLYAYVSLTDTLNNAEMIRQFQTVTYNENLRQQQLNEENKQERQRFVNRVKTFILLGGLAIVGVLAIILYRNNKQKQRINVQLREQKMNVESTLAELKIMQNQLVQSEKMASLGELTAGIAHEIQNPLNFVNNFSEVNRDLLKEMVAEIEKGNYGEAKIVAQDVIDNENKIVHHGKRAEAIVKSMLQHSRSSTTKMELTDINQLVDEYVRLAYHGLRAKDKNFNAKFETELDPGLGEMNVNRQEIGRVILNLINNAFQAVSEKKKMGEPGYEPTVWIKTKKLQGTVQIRVKDNGPGIPENLRTKIFQPFFTTKPSGQGTGLGLSLSYDIIKAHNGEINVKTIQGKETEFTVILPA
jgi:signal transduction histidine kinase